MKKENPWNRTQEEELMLVLSHFYQLEWLVNPKNSGHFYMESRVLILLAKEKCCFFDP